MDIPIRPEQVRDAIRVCMSFSSWTSSLKGDAGERPREPDPRIRKWLEGVRFSHRLVFTYHLVIFGLIVLIAAAHWSEKALQWRRGRFIELRDLEDDSAYDGDATVSKSRMEAIEVEAEARDMEGTSSASSSTMLGNPSPPQKNMMVAEHTPLLHAGHALRPLAPRTSLLQATKALLMYQPKPIPLVNKVLPANGTTIALTAFMGLNVFYTLFRININDLELVILSFRAADIFVANLPLLYLLAAKTQPLRVLTGFSYESLNILHRRLGEILMLEALIHTVATLVVWYTILRPVGMTLGHFLLVNVVLIGLGTFLAYVLLYFTSLASFRQRWYELFLVSHVFLQAAALIGVFFHHPASRAYVGIALAIFMIDRIVYRIGLKSITVAASLDLMEDKETVRLSATIDLYRKNFTSRILGRNIRHGWEAADHIFVSIPSLARKHIIQAHPFTISSPAPNKGASEAKIDLLIRAQDGFSADIVREAIQRSSISMRIDGPYGSSHARDMIQHADLAILVAGGSGIAVCWPLLQFMMSKTRSSDTEIASTPQLLRQDIALIWVVHKSSQLSWIGQQELANVEAKGVRVIVPSPTEEAGRPDIESVINSLFGESGKAQRIGVVGSGPDSLGRDVRNTCARLARDGRNIGVTIEKFGW